MLNCIPIAAVVQKLLKKNRGDCFDPQARRSQFIWSSYECALSLVHKFLLCTWLSGISTSDLEPLQSAADSSTKFDLSRWLNHEDISSCIWLDGVEVGTLRSALRRGSQEQHCAPTALGRKKSFCWAVGDRRVV